MVLIDCDVQEADTQEAKSVRRGTHDMDTVRKASDRGVMLVRMQFYWVNVGEMVYFHFPLKTIKAI